MRKSIYFAYTSYHVFLAMLMALSESEEANEQVLVIVSNFADAEVLYKALQNCRTSPFHRVIYFQGEQDWHHYSCWKQAFLRYWGCRKIARKLLYFLKKEAAAHCYLFNEDRPYSLALLEYAKSRKGTVTMSSIEDGAIFYNSFIARKSQRYLFLGKIAYGLWWKNVEVMGTSEIFKDVWTLFPEFVRPELERKMVRRISTVGLTKLLEKKIADDLLTAYGISSEEIRKLKYIILLSHSSVISQFPEYRNVLIRIINNAQKSGHPIAIKYHPRDSTDFLNLKDEPGVHFLRASAPLELIYLLGRESILGVVADLSTSLLSALLILSTAKIISTSALFGGKDDRFLNMVRSLGGDVPATFDEFARLFHDSGTLSMQLGEDVVRNMCRFQSEAQWMVGGVK